MEVPWDDKKPLKAALYVRRSEGEGGTTGAQLDRILPAAKRLVRGKKIQSLNETVVGKDITGKRKFNRQKDLAIQGDIYNEGEGASGFGFDRPVLRELISRMKAGEYDLIIVETMDRLARDWTGLVDALGAALWRVDGKRVYGIANGEYLAQDPIQEAIINTRMTWGGVAKKDEIKKAEKGRVGSALDKGFFKSSAPEFLGTKGKQHGLDYRKAWRLMQAYGENNKGRLNSPSAVGNEFSKDNKWASSWYARLKGYNELGVLEAWLDAYEAINAYTEALGGYPRNQWRSNPELKRIVKASSGFFGYPAGVNVAGTEEFVIFPSPLTVGLDALASVADPTVLENFMVIREPLGKRQLSIWQTQQRTRK